MNIQVVCGAPPQYTVGGTVSGLSGTGLVLENNGGDNLSITGNGSFTFNTSISSGSTYSVTVLTEPSAPAQLCSVPNGSGTATTNVTNVQVACTIGTTATGEWTWMGGSNLAGAAGSYGTLGVVAQANLPPGRQGTASWIDKSGNLWLFGGSIFGTPKFSDLWEFQPRGFRRTNPLRLRPPLPIPLEGRHTVSLVRASCSRTISPTT